MEQGDIIRITDVQAMDGYAQPIRNVYYYLVATATGEQPLQTYAEDIVGAFYTKIIVPMLALQSASIKHVEVEFFNMSFQQEEATQTWDTPIPGSVAGEVMPANVAYSIKLQRYSRVVRNGAKRISGVPEIATTQGRILISAYTSLMATLTTAMSTPMAVEGDSVDSLFSPIICRVPQNPGVTPTVYTQITEGSFRGFGTQNTRKQL